MLKSLLILQGEKTLSFREKKQLDRARHLLLTELMIARTIRQPEAEAVLEKALNKAGLNLPPGVIDEINCVSTY